VVAGLNLAKSFINIYPYQIFTNYLHTNHEVMEFLQVVPERFEEQPGEKWARASLRNAELVDMITSLPVLRKISLNLP
jgi:hypothetical protein